MREIKGKRESEMIKLQIILLAFPTLDVGALYVALNNSSLVY